MQTTVYRYEDWEIQCASTEELSVWMEEERHYSDTSHVHADNFNRIRKELNNRHKHNTTNRGW